MNHDLLIWNILHDSNIASFHRSDNEVTVQFGVGIDLIVRPLIELDVHRFEDDEYRIADFESWSSVFERSGFEISMTHFSEDSFAIEGFTLVDNGQWLIRLSGSLHWSPCLAELEVSHPWPN